ncbi:MAG TPA: oligopeptide/dipeptide ABC transporter ATP-binding protein [Reyranella sp.]|nr:oligopeptide/dipeptide ABC transporter ATP-binding protein [Reyranella sp.]
MSFDIMPGETVGLVGESGSGKSTLGRVIVGLLPATGGEITIDGESVGALHGRSRAKLWRHVQMVFQDPYSSLNPRMTVRDALAEPLRNFGIARGPEADARIRKTLDACGLPTTAMTRYPREFSGGQRQRIGIARALIVRPDFIVADEPVSALDVSIQAQIINLLQDLKSEFGLTYLFIAHDLAVIRHVSDRVAVMYRGKLVETAPAATLYDSPRHPYTQLLLRSVPVPDPRAEAERRRNTIDAEVVNTEATDSGCPFAARCPKATFPICGAAPSLTDRGSFHQAACHLA